METDLKKFIRIFPQTGESIPTKTVKDIDYFQVHNTVKLFQNKKYLHMFIIFFEGFFIFSKLEVLTKLSVHIL